MKKVVVASILLLVWNSAAHAYDPVTDFSITSNQNVAEVWSYGQSATAGGDFSLLTTAVGSSAFNANIEEWRGTSSGFGGGFPTITYNKTTSTQTYLTVTHPADEILLHPGPGGQYSVLRFVAPSAGTYRFQGTFTGRDSAPATTDVSIRQNSVNPLFSAGINLAGSGNVATFNVAPVLAAGDTIDFSVGYGNSFYGNDSTGLKLTASPVVVPEAATLALFLPAMGIVGGAIIHRRRK